MEASPVHTVINFEVTDKFCNVIFIDQSHRTKHLPWGQECVHVYRIIQTIPVVINSN